MSLGTFFRDYVYIPLGGNRKGKIRQIFNIFAVWALTGLWHGAAWNFVLWGLYFFVLLIIEKFFLLNKLNKNKIFGRIYLLTAVYFGWVFFKFTDFSILSTVLKGMFGLNGNRIFTYEAFSFSAGYIIFFIICVFACTPIVKLAKRILISLAKKNIAANYAYRIADIAFPPLLVILSAISLVGDSYNPFLYFQF